MSSCVVIAGGLRPHDLRQPEPHQLVVDRPARSAANDQREASPRLTEPLRRVIAAAIAAVGAVGAVGVPVAVHLRQQADVDGLLLGREAPREHQRIVVAAALRDLARADDLLARVVVGGRDAEHSPGLGLRPAPERPPRMRAPDVEGLQHRRVVVDVQWRTPRTGPRPPSLRSRSRSGHLSAHSSSRPPPRRAMPSDAIAASATATALAFCLGTGIPFQNTRTRPELLVRRLAWRAIVADARSPTRYPRPRAPAASRTKGAEDSRGKNPGDDR